MAYETKIILDSVTPAGARLTTFQLTLPRIVLAELNTHNMVSKNSASSRAMPVKKKIARIEADPFVPKKFGKNTRGMQNSSEDLDEQASAVANASWRGAIESAIGWAKKLADVEVHKQLANRLIEFADWHTVVATATEWSNYFALRDHANAQDEIRDSAHEAHELWKKNEPTLVPAGEWHLPYVTGFDVGAFVWKPEDLVAISAGRCAAVSYLNQENQLDPLGDFDRAWHKLIPNGHMCFDAKTEVLTRDGWKLWSVVQPSDFLFVVDVATRTGWFEKSEALHAYEIDEPIYRVFGQQLDLAVTLNHRMVCAARRNDGTWKPFGFEEARDVHSHPRRYLKAVTFEGHGDVPSYDRTIAFMRLLGFFIGDGYTAGGNTIQFHLKKARKVEYLKSLGFAVRDMANNKYVVDAPRIGEWFRTNCYGVDKQKVMPEWVLSLTAAQALALFDGLKNSDGSIRRNTWIYSTTSRQVADMLQALLHIHGKVGSLTSTSYGDDKIAIRVNVSDRTMPRVEVTQEGRSVSYEEHVGPYKGMVYCATTSTGALMVRRNGHVVVSGNSPTEHPAQSLTRDEWVHFGMAQAVRWVNDRIPVGNFWGWKQWRKTIANEHDFSLLEKK